MCRPTPATVVEIFGGIEYGVNNLIYIRGVKLSNKGVPPN